MIKTRKYTSNYTGKLFDKNDNFVDSFSCIEEALDLSLQIVAEYTDGYYFIFDFDENCTKCSIDSGGGVSNHPDKTPTSTEMCREIGCIQINDLPNSPGGYKYRTFY